LPAAKALLCHAEIFCDAALAVPSGIW
jgi:hypothetical protein